jgi:hypothetical protein
MDVGELAMYAGQSAGLVTAVESAHAIVSRFHRQCREVLAG